MIKYSGIFIVSSFIFLNLVGFYYLLQRTHKISKTEINLVLTYDKPKNTYALDKKSVEFFQKSLQELQYNFSNHEKLLGIFEREREHYVLLITILIGIMTIFTLYFGFTRLVEKQEYENIQREFICLKKEITDEIKIIHKITLKYEFKFMNDLFDSNVRFVNNNNQTIRSIEEFSLKVEIRLNELSRKLNEFDNSVIIDNRFPIRNLINSISNYAKNKSYITDIKWDIDSNPIFRTIIKEFYKNLKQENYVQLIKELKKFYANINLGEFDVNSN